MEKSSNKFRKVIILFYAFIKVFYSVLIVGAAMCAAVGLHCILMYICPPHIYQQVFRVAKITIDKHMKETCKWKGLLTFVFITVTLFKIFLNQF